MRTYKCRDYTHIIIIFYDKFPTERDIFLSPCEVKDTPLGREGGLGVSQRDLYCKHPSPLIGPQLPTWLNTEL